VTVRLAGAGTRSGDTLVGADGLFSRIREAVLGPRPPRYAGYTAWRAVARVGGMEPGTAFETWGRGRRFGALDIGGGRTYWYAAENAPQGGRDLDARLALLSRFAGWHEPIEALLDATPSPAVLRHDVFHLRALPVWSVGRVTLLGDAAHAMTPDLGQGACQAIEDAWVLADRLAGAADVPAALRAYEARRRGRAGAIARRSRWVGRVAQASRPRLCRLRDAALRATPPATSLRSLRARARRAPA
jgi:2-polyprenyl-6-methoxyphenol hydroxylase-like FAD-dependent oxidoreductase